MTQDLVKEDLQRRPPPTRLGVALFLSALIMMFFCNNLFVPSVFQGGPSANPIGAGLVVGICFSQLNLISVWAAVSQGHVIVRLPWAYLLVELMWVSLVVGNRMGGNVMHRGDTLTLGVVLAVCCTVAQLPLWIASRVFQWRLRGPSTHSDSETSSSSQFQLGHMFLGTVILAVSLAASRMLMSGNRGDIQLGLDRQLYFILPVLTIVNLVTVIPAIWAAFFVPVSLVSIGKGLLASLGITCIELVVLCAAFGTAPSLYEISCVFLAINAAQIGVVFFVLRILKGFGFRFTRLVYCVARRPRFP